MATFSNEVERLFRAAGWIPERRVPVTHWVRALVSEGYTPSSYAVELLSNVGGLTLNPVEALDAAFAPESVVFDPLLGGSGEYGRVVIWEKALNVHFFPIAQVFRTQVLLVSSESIFYAGIEQDLYILGSTLDQAIRNVCIPSSPLSICYRYDNST